MSTLGQWRGGGRRAGGGGGWETPFFSSPYSSDIWDPWSSAAGGITGWSTGADRDDDVSALAHAHVDWRETDRAHIFRVDLPGVKKEDLKVQVEDDNILHINGERIVENVDENDKWHRVERRRGSFSRRFRLPENVNLDGIKCELAHGVLSVEIPKRDVQEQPRNVRYIDIA